MCSSVEKKHRNEYISITLFTRVSRRGVVVVGGGGVEGGGGKDTERPGGGGGGGNRSNWSGNRTTGASP